MRSLNQLLPYRRVFVHPHTLMLISSAKIFQVKMRSCRCTTFAVTWIRVKFHAIQWDKMCWVNRIHCKYNWYSKRISIPTCIPILSRIWVFFFFSPGIYWLLRFLFPLYSSELIRNRTLDFLSKTLPVLKADDTLPKVTQILDEQIDVIDNNG